MLKGCCSFGSDFRRHCPLIAVAGSSQEPRRAQPSYQEAIVGPKLVAHYQEDPADYSLERVRLAALLQAPLIPDLF